MSIDETIKQSVREAVAEAVAPLLQDKDQITVSTTRAAEMLDVHPSYILELVKNGVLKPVTWPQPEGAKGRPRLYFLVEDLRNAAKQHSERKVS